MKKRTKADKRAKLAIQVMIGGFAALMLYGALTDGVFKNDFFSATIFTGIAGLCIWLMFNLFGDDWEGWQG